jgi:hypothetical protein
MTTPVSVTVLLEPETADEILATLLEVGELAGLPVTTWRAGDPTRAQWRGLARKLESADAIQTELAKAAFITGPEGQRAEGEWLSLRVADVYGVEREEEEFATPTIELDNAGGGVFEIDALGATFSNSLTGATYKNQLPFTIDALETGVEVLLIADEGGSAGTIGLDEIDTIVSPTLTGVVIVGNTASAGVDEQSDEGLIEQALATLGALSPNGPADAYEFVARSETLTTVAGVTRALGDGDTSDGTVTVYVATTTAALSAPNVALIQAAIDTWAQPLCTDATVVSGTAQTIPVTLTGLDSEAQDVVEAALDTLFASIEFAGLVARDAITSAARVAAVAGGFPPGGGVGCTSPAVDSTLATGVFPVRGTVTLA